MSEQLYCRTCGKTRSGRGEGQCRACAARLSGRRYGKSKPFVTEQASDKARRAPAGSWWLEPNADYAEAATRMAGNGWTE
jgi:hypothetical protein